MTDGYLSINGRRRLSGETRVQGCKNAALPCLTACLLCERGEACLSNCPYLTDVENTAEILERLGAVCRFDEGGHAVSVKAENVFGSAIDNEMMNRMRSSVLFMGALLSRTGEADLGYPGGCEIGARPIDMHIRAFRELGVDIDEEGGMIRCRLRSGLRPCQVSLLCPSVGATENIMLLTAKSEGRTVIRNAAREPEIVDLQNFLNAMGADIRGAGSDVIVINGAKELRGADYGIMPDRIAALTYMAAAAACGGKIFLRGANPEHLAVCVSVLRDMGVSVKRVSGGMIVSMSGRPNAVNTIKTLYYPGFPTDAQPAFMAAATVAKGTTVFVESIFENRFRHAPELKKLGADIDVNMCQATVRGKESLSGADVRACDLRGGAAMVIGGLVADGTTRVYGVSHIERGYENISRDFSNLGADIRMIY